MIQSVIEEFLNDHRVNVHILIFEITWVNFIFTLTKIINNFSVFVHRLLLTLLFFFHFFQLSYPFALQRFESISLPRLLLFFGQGWLFCTLHSIDLKRFFFNHFKVILFTLFFCLLSFCFLYIEVVRRFLRSKDINSCRFLVWYGWSNFKKQFEFTFVNLSQLIYIV